MHWFGLDHVTWRSHLELHSLKPHSYSPISGILSSSSLNKGASSVFAMLSETLIFLDKVSATDLYLLKLLQQDWNAICFMSHTWSSVMNKYTWKSKKVYNSQNIIIFSTFFPSLFLVYQKPVCLCLFSSATPQRTADSEVTIPDGSVPQGWQSIVG